MVSSVVLAVGEMGALVPLSGGVVRYAEYFFDPAMSFANGWNQVYSYCVSVPAEIVAAAVLVEFWTTINNAVWITIFGLLMFATAVLFVRIYGELEFTFAMLKIMLIVGINIMVRLMIRNSGMAVFNFLIGSCDHLWWRPRPYIHRLSLLAQSWPFCSVPQHLRFSRSICWILDDTEQRSLCLFRYREHYSCSI